MLDAAFITQGMRMLDVAASAGDQTRSIVLRVCLGAHVLATDISATILNFAHETALRAGLGQVQTKCGAAEDLRVLAEIFDAAVPRLGLMLCPALLRTLEQMHHALEPRGKASVRVFWELQNNPCVVILMATALKNAGMPPQEPFQPGSLLSPGKPGMLEGLFDQTRFHNVTSLRVAALFGLPLRQRLSGLCAHLSVADHANFERTRATGTGRGAGRNAGAAPGVSNA